MFLQIMFRISKKKKKKGLGLIHLKKCATLCSGCRHHHRSIIYFIIIVYFSIVTYALIIHPWSTTQKSHSMSNGSTESLKAAVHEGKGSMELLWWESSCESKGEQHTSEVQYHNLMIMISAWNNSQQRWEWRPLFKLLIVLLSETQHTTVFLIYISVRTTTVKET